MEGLTEVNIKFTTIFNRYALTAYRVCLSRRRLRAVSFRLIGVVIRYFFIPQFQRKRGKLSCPIVSVDDELDTSIPFKPEYLPVYMSFTMLWISTIGFIYRAYDKKAEGDIFTLFRLIERAYVEAFWVYSRIMTTTKRPNAQWRHIKLKMMQAVDPHYHCVPSLHVIIVCITWLFLERISGKHGRPDLSELRDLVYNRSIMITESVLFMKQHSINCIPAGLYAVTRYSDKFTPSVAEDFIDQLFIRPETNVPEAEKIRAFMKERYRELVISGGNDHGNYKYALLSFLKEFTLNNRVN